MKIYHYSKELYTSLEVGLKRLQLSRFEITKARLQAAKYFNPGAYFDHISFFFDPVPLNIIGDLFRGENDFWKNGNEIIEYTIDVDSLDKNITYFVAESPSQVKTLDAIEWVDTDEFLIAYLEKQSIASIACGETGHTLTGLKEQIKRYKGTTTKYYKEAIKRNDFKENITKYAANVPHLMLYPSSGNIEIASHRSVMVGSSVALEQAPNFLNWK